MATGNIHAKKKKKKKGEKRKVHGGKGRCGAPAERAELRTLLIASSQTRLLIRPVVLNTSPSGSHVLLGLLGTSGIAKRKRQKGFICIHRIDYGKEIKAIFWGETNETRCKQFGAVSACLKTHKPVAI